MHRVLRTVLLSELLDFERGKRIPAEFEEWTLTNWGDLKEVTAEKD
jgi:hypothetical protein